MLKIRELEQKLEELQKRRTNIENEIYDIDHREKQEVVRLVTDVGLLKNKVSDCKDQLKKSVADLEAKRARLEELRQSETRGQYFDLLVKKSKVERRIIKWKMLLKDSKETIQSLESFSAVNSQKRKELSLSLQKLEKCKFMRNEDLDELKNYSESLARLIKANSENRLNY